MTDLIKANLLAIAQKKKEVAATTKLKNQLESKHVKRAEKNCKLCGRLLNPEYRCTRCGKQ